MTRSPFEAPAPSPADLHAIERNLQRERRVFAMVVLLLALVVVASAAATALVRLNGSLRAQEQVARLYEQGVVDALLARRSTLAATNLILELHASGTFPAPPSRPAGQFCRQVATAGPPDEVLQRSCDQAVRTLTAASQKPSIEMIALASGAMYRYEAAEPAPAATRAAPPRMPPAAVIAAVLESFRGRDPDLLQAAREKRVIWKGIPAGADGHEPEILGASLVAQGDALYAIVLTRMPLRELLRPAGPNLPIPEPVVFDRAGTPLVAAAARAGMQRLDLRLAQQPDGLFHWVPDYGWALRRPPLVADFGHLIFALPIGHQLGEIAGELSVIGLVAAALIGLLLAMYRYWNYRFLTGTYAESARAQRLLHEARLASDAAARARVAFFASMSHEIRTPLASLLGNLELVAMGALEPAQRARVGAMQMSAEGLLRIVNDVLDFSRIDVGAFSLAEEPVSVTAFFSRIVLAHAPLAGQRKLGLFAVYDTKLPARLELDPVRVTQIVSNLLGNAFKFTPAGKVVLRARWIDGQLEIVVSDTGIGIPEDCKGRLFQPFSQVGDNRLGQARGTGLGLSVCLRLVERMQGHIALDSILGVGTRVTVRLPLRVADAAPPPRPQLPRHRALVLAREAECLEGLLHHFDWGACQPSARTGTDAPVDAERFDCLLVADGFDPVDVIAWWRRPAAIVWLKQSGPLVATTRPDGGTEVSAYSLSGIHAAVMAVVTGMQALPSAGDSRCGGDAGRVPAPLAGRVALVAEDNLLNRNLLRDQLLALGASVIEADNGNEAMTMLTQHGVDTVLTDIDMPGMNGFDLLGEIRRAGMRIPVYAVSASAQPDDVARGQARGFSGYLTKPVSLAALAAVLARGDGTSGATQRESGAQPDTAADDELAGLPELPAVPGEYAEAFLAQTGTDLAQCDAVRAARDLQRLEPLLHRISGTLAVLGGSQLAELCADLRDYVADKEDWDDEIECQSGYIAQRLRLMCEALAGGQAAAA
ncbi:hybrid sensor histidine kinase/response regulator [Cupriavidus neocaledonicus]|uniref:histidine kinase n=1 Tax=Cupriavidus neocaledonicus TaxID=1040979 RepID=A0A375H9K4_9BURK|nr:hybrid sensor histidine kinase/response regulator [Cupriavidus neocaledonicus]SOZ34927.1 Sensor protein RcsC [Cupriavidus neocaledonicus]SPD46870.1 Two-component system, NarL family, capsular synthesis sensor histidine kinase RcsC [Cupriavidus neocaledonicus]